jgi:hypothetical protein
MSPRPTFLATALALGLLAGCTSNNRATPADNPAESGGTPAPSTEAPRDTAPKPTPPAPDDNGTPSAPGTGAPGSTSGASAQSGTYYVKDSGVRCITTPCMSYRAYRADQPDEEGTPISDLDLSAVAGDDEKRAPLLDQTHNGGRGLKVEARILPVPKAGPGGDGTRLTVNRVLEGK